MCVTPCSIAVCTLCSREAVVCPGMPHIKSTLTLSKRSCAAATARLAPSALCARPSVASTLSSKLCTPMDRRFTPSAQMSRTMAGVRLSGFASMVHSTSGSRRMDRLSVYSSMDRRLKPTCEGVPPPRYTVSMLPSSPSRALRRICRQSSSMYSSMSGLSCFTADVVKSQ